MAAFFVLDSGKFPWHGERDSLLREL